MPRDASAQFALGVVAGEPDVAQHAFIEFGQPAEGWIRRQAQSRALVFSSEGLRRFEALAANTIR